MSDDDKKGITLSINVIGIIITITALIISILNLFNVFEDSQQEEKICPPNQCNITSNNCSSTTYLSCPAVVANELLNTPILKSSKTTINNLIFNESLTIGSVENNVKFLNGLTTDLKIDTLNVSFQNISAPNITSTNLSTQNIDVDNSINVNLVKAKEISCTNITFSNATILNPIITTLNTNFITGTNFVFNKFNLSKSNLSINNLSTSNIDFNTGIFTNVSFTGNLFDISSTPKTYIAKNIKVSEKMNIQSINNTITNLLNVSNSTFTNVTFSYLQYDEINVNNRLICSSLHSFVNSTNSNHSLKADNVISTPVLNTKNLIFTNISLQGTFSLTNNLIVNTLSTTNQDIKNIIVDKILVENETKDNININNLKLNHNTINLINLTLTKNTTTIFLIQDSDTIKMAINDSNTLIPYCEKIYLTTNLDNTKLFLKIYIKAGENFNPNLFVSTSLSLLVSTKRLNSNLQIIFSNEVVSNNLFFYSSKFLYNSFLPSNILQEYICTLPFRDNNNNYIPTISTIDYYNNQLLPINDTINIFCFDYFTDFYLGKSLAYQVSATK
jgi:hypothetical protein